MASKQIIRRAFATTRLTALEEFPHKTFVAAAAKAPVAQESTTGNGIKLMSKDHNSMIVGLKFSMMSGSRKETEEQQGAAEYLAAGAFTGNKTSSGVRTVRCLEGLGTAVDVHAGREHITYSVTCLPDKVEQTVAEVMAAIAQPPTDAHALSDIAHDVDYRYSALSADPVVQLDEALHDAAFGECSPLGASRFAVNSHRLDVNDVLAYRQAHFNAKNLVVASSGIAHDQLKQIVESCAASANLSAGDSSDTASASPFVGGETRIRRDLAGQTYVAVGFPVPSGDDANSYAVLKHYLGKCGSGAFIHSYTSGGVWGFSACGNGAEGVNAQLNAAVATLKAVADGSASAGVEAAKTSLAVERMSDMESSHEKSSEAMLTAHRNGVSTDKYCHLSGVSAASVQAAAKATLSCTNPAYAAIGRTTQAPSFDMIKKLVKA